jgi:hypothetical protein
MQVFFRGHGEWITSIHSPDINDQTGQPYFFTSLSSQNYVCGFFELPNRDSEIEYKHNKTLESAYCLYPCTEHLDSVLPPEIDWEELGSNEPNSRSWCVEDFCISSRFFIDKTQKFLLVIKDSSPPIKTDITSTERSTMLKLIIGMAMDAYGYDKDKRRNNATGTNKGSIKAGLEKKGILMDDETIRKYLKEAENFL